jgi:hypothetical protein
VAAIKLIVGEVVPVSLQAFDGATGLFPQCILKDSSGTILTTLDLAHVGAGLYTNRTYSMPDNAIVTAQYKVYTDATHTTLDLNYQDDLDVFVRDIPDSQKFTTDGTIYGTINDEDALVGIVDEIEEADLVGVVDDGDEVFGVIEDDELIGYILDDTVLVGTIESCT